MLLSGDGDFTASWDEHCKDAALLSQYSDAMYRLANDVWTKHDKTRIDWSVKLVR